MLIGEIPKWAWIFFFFVVFDDALLWFWSPYLMITLILIVLVAAIFLAGGKDMGMGLLNITRMQESGIISGITAKSAKTILKKDRK